MDLDQKIQHSFLTSIQAKQKQQQADDDLARAACRDPIIPIECGPDRAAAAATSEEVRSRGAPPPTASDIAAAAFAFPAPLPAAAINPFFMARKPGGTLGPAPGAAAPSGVLRPSSAPLGKMLPPIHVQQLGQREAAGMERVAEGGVPPPGPSAVIEALLDETCCYPRRLGASLERGQPSEEIPPTVPDSILVSKASPSREALASSILAERQRAVERSRPLLAASRFWPPAGPPPQSESGGASRSEPQTSPSILATCRGEGGRGDLLWQLAERTAAETLCKGGALQSKEVGISVLVCMYLSHPRSLTCRRHLIITYRRT